jgi:aryl-alcohol dehydrogenase-like predicted oxidoreductase
MEYRKLGSTGLSISSLSFGAWAIGGTWGPLNDEEGLAALHRAVDLGVNFIDTADVYGDGHSERLIAKLRRERREPLIVATKAGRGASPHTVANYSKDALRGFVERSLKNLACETLDLLQLHCPPSDVYYRAEVFAALDDLKAAGLIRHYGVSVERVEEALKAIEYPGVESVQIVYNLFRQRPAELFFREAVRRNVGIIVRLPLSSGLLTGKLSQSTQFAAEDHRNFNRHGAAFDRGETFSGIDYETALSWLPELLELVPAGATLAQFALRWILMNEAVTCAIPGARRPGQVEENLAALKLPPLSLETMAATHRFYQQRAKPLAHHAW